ALTFELAILKHVSQRPFAELVYRASVVRSHVTRPRIRALPTIVRRVALLAGIVAAAGAVGYFTGRLLRASDLDQEQSYLRKIRCMRRRRDDAEREQRSSRDRRTLRTQ